METAQPQAAQVVHTKSPAVVIRKAAAQGIRYALVLLVALLFLVPWLWLLSTSLKPPQQILEIPPRLMPDPVMWINYYYGVTYINFFKYLGNTLIVTFAVIIGRLISCSLVGYSLACIQWKGRNILFGIVLATMMLPAQVTMIPVFIIFTRLGWINTFLPLTVPAFFGDAFFIFLLRQFFMTIPKELLDAARLDGANHWNTFRRVVMPLAKPALATVIAFSFIWTFTDFQGPLIYLKDRDLWTLSLGMRGYLQRYGAGGGTAMGAMMAAATLYTLPMIIIFFVAQKTFIQGVVTSGLKG